jgi:hypothetical protein
MREQLETLNYQQLLKVARSYNMSQSIPLPTNVSKADLITAILKHAKDVGQLLSVLASVRGEQQKAAAFPKVKRTPDMSDEEFAAMERRKARFERRLDRAKAIYEPLEGETMSKADEKAYKARVKAIKADYKGK